VVSLGSACHKPKISLVIRCTRHHTSPRCEGGTVDRLSHHYRLACPTRQCWQRGSQFSSPVIYAHRMQMSIFWSKTRGTQFSTCGFVTGPLRYFGVTAPFRGVHSNTRPTNFYREV
jgi:hypothetical protein